MLRGESRKLSSTRLVAGDVSPNLGLFVRLAEPFDPVNWFALRTFSGFFLVFRLGARFGLYLTAWWLPIPIENSSKTIMERIRRHGFLLL